MTILQPPIETIERAYAAWLHAASTDDAGAQTRTLESEPAETDAIESAGFEPGRDSPTEHDTHEHETHFPDFTMDFTPDSMPDFIADAIDRQTTARVERRRPQAGDIVLLSPAPSEQPGLEPQQPVAVLLDEAVGRGWSGWLVGAHIDYAGDRDLVLDSALIQDSTDPAPIAGMVLCWNQVMLGLPGEARVLHRLTGDALAIVRALAIDPPVHAEAPNPGRMCLRQIGEHVFVTGTPYLRDDLRAPYLRLTRELARRVSEPEFDDQGQVRQPERDGPQR